MAPRTAASSLLLPVFCQSAVPSSCRTVAWSKWPLLSRAELLERRQLTRTQLAGQPFQETEFLVRVQVLGPAGERIWPNCGLALTGHRSAFPSQDSYQDKYTSSPFLGTYSLSKSTPLLRIGLPLLSSLCAQGWGRGDLPFCSLSFLIWRRPIRGAGPAVYLAPSFGRPSPSAAVPERGQPQEAGPLETTQAQQVLSRGSHTWGRRLGLPGTCGEGTG